MPFQDLIDSMLRVDPKKRVSSMEALKHPWIAVSKPIKTNYCYPDVATYLCLKHTVNVNICFILG